MTAWSEEQIIKELIRALPIKAMFAMIARERGNLHTECVYTKSYYRTLDRLKKLDKNLYESLK